MIRALIVDDEPLVRERIRSLLSLHPDFALWGECEDGFGALEATRLEMPDVVFLDIQMPGMSGLEVVEAWQEELRLPHIVFITAFDQYAVQAFRLQALDYLMKPFSNRSFGETLARIRMALGPRDLRRYDQRVQAMLEAHERRQQVKPHLLVRESEGYLLVRTADVHAIEATGNYVCLHCDRGQHLMRSTLASLEARLDPARFFRTHRSWIVNLDQIREAQPWERGGWILLTRSGLKVPVSPQHRDDLLRHLE